jgi:AcrR family transcriptional regulator
MDIEMVTEPTTTAERRTPLTKDRVLQAAVDLADRGGYESLSMRKLGQELSVDAMALYRHVRGKDDLLDGLVEVIVGQIEAPSPAGDWKATLRAQAMAARAVMLRHPWARQVLEERGTGGPATLAHIEFALTTLHDAGFSIELAHHTLHALGSRIFGFTQDLFEETGPTDPPPDPAAVARAMAGYPNIVELAMSVSHEGVLGRCDDDVEFAFGLDLVLDGLERLLAGSGASR